MCICYICRFEAKLPEIFKDIHEAYEQIDARLKAEQFKVVHSSSLCFLNVRLVPLICDVY